MGNIKTIQLDATTKGAHNVGVLRTLTTEWNPDDRSAQEFKNMVLKELNALRNNVPNFDSGYFYIEGGSKKYRLEHPNLGGVPNRVICYFSTKAEPAATDVVTPIPLIVFTDTGNVSGMVKSGLKAEFEVNGNSTLISTSANVIIMHDSAYDSGYIRLLLWR
ncbi:MAG: hypothetical protein ABIK92_21760 [Pseudomonadota bacterium]